MTASPGPSPPGGAGHRWSLCGTSCADTAKALAVDPAVLVLDEDTSASDVSVQARILALLNEIRSSLGVTLVFVTYDLAVVGQVTDEPHPNRTAAGPSPRL